MSIATYSELQTKIKDWLHRGDLDSIVPDFISLAEARINGDLDARFQDAIQSITTVASTPNITLPNDLIAIRSVIISADPIRVLKYVTPDQWNVLYPTTRVGMPEIYTVINTEIWVNPAPDSAYTMKVLYKARVPALSNTTTTNTILTTYPHVYLYAALCEAAPYLKDDARIAVWDAKYRESIQTVNAQDWYSGSTMAVRTDVRP